MDKKFVEQLLAGLDVRDRRRIIGYITGLEVRLNEAEDNIAKLTAALKALGERTAFLD